MSSADRVGRFQNWENIAATNDTELLFDGPLILGDTGSGTGTLSVDARSTLFAGQGGGAINAFAAGQLVDVINAGRIDLTNGGTSLADRFTIGGNYVGDNGLLLLETNLGDDSSPSDRLVIDGGSASGTSSISIVNINGPGDVTAVDGIMVVEAAGGAVTTPGAFSLNGPVAAGAFEYFLFKGGVTTDTGENWYLRSNLVAPPPPPPTPQVPDPPAPPPPAPAPAPSPTQPIPPVIPQPVPPEPAPPPPPPAPPPAQPNGPAAVPPPAPAAASPSAPPPAPPVPPTALPIPPSLAALEPTPIYRVEVATYSVVPPLASYLGTATLGTFHERRGEQDLLQGTGLLPTTWSRVFGQSADIGWSGTVSPSFDGSLVGFQIGSDVAGFELLPGHEDRLGLFFGYVRADGDVKGQALAQDHFAAGDVKLNGTSLGGYWTHIGPGGWYVDGVVMNTWFDGEATSVRDIGVDIQGSGLTASLEGGYPFAIADGWTIEPQAQLVWQHLSFDDKQDRFSDVSFNADDGLNGRLGVRVQGEMMLGSTQLMPYLKANIWRQFDSDQNVSFAGTDIVTELGGTSLEIGGGMIAKLSDRLSLYMTGDYTTNISGEDIRAWEGNVGLSVSW